MGSSGIYTRQARNGELTGSPGAPAKPGAPSLPAAPCTHDRKKPVSFTAYTMRRIRFGGTKKIL